MPFSTARECYYNYLLIVASTIPKMLEIYGEERFQRENYISDGSHHFITVVLLTLSRSKNFELNFDS